MWPRCRLCQNQCGNNAVGQPRFRHNLSYDSARFGYPGEQAMHRRQFCLNALTLAAAGLITSPLHAEAVSEQQILIDRARSTVETFTTQSDMEQMRRLLHRARGILIFPEIIKAA